MNDETENVPGETDESTSQENETEVTETNDGSVTEATEAAQVEMITIQEVQAIGSDIVHTSLFGSFLICGTLIGLAILRKVHGT